MPILVDFNQVAISNLMINLKMNQLDTVDEDMLRHMILNSLRFNRNKFTEDYGELIICCDGRNTWRREVFPFYKRNRKKTRAASGYDWNHIFETLNKIRQELDERMPYKVVHLEKAEADDIIAVLAKQWSKDEKVLILSGDKDFMQLQKYDNVKQYSPVQKKFLRTVYGKGQVALIVGRKLANESVKAMHESLTKWDIFGMAPKLDETLVGDLWLFLEYRDQGSAKKFYNAVRPRRAKASDF